MGEVLTTTLILSGLCVIFGVVLAFANKRFYVFEDPKIDKVEEMLPGANCGACEMPGCRAFAEKVVSGDLNPSKCTVSSSSGIDQIANLLGITASKSEKKIARLLCAGGKNEAHNLIEYKGGLSTCRGESVVSGGPKECSWGCLGLGDCAEVCDFDAISMNDNGLPQVDPIKCTACNDCVEICPKDLFTIMPISQNLIVQCKSELEGDLALNKCAVACNTCGRCVADAPPDLISMEHSLPVIDYKLNHLATPASTLRCPTGAIVWLENESQFQQEVVDSSLPLGQVQSIDDLENNYFQ